MTQYHTRQRQLAGKVDKQCTAIGGSVSIKRGAIELGYGGLPNEKHKRFVSIGSNSFVWLFVSNRIDDEGRTVPI